jgi:hypothetical protein
MTPEPFDPDVVELLREHVASVEALELLVLLHRTRGRAWTPADAAARLGLAEDLLVPELQALEAHGLATSQRVEGELVWRYAPRTAALDQRVGRLGELYAARGLEVVRFLSAEALERIRAGARGLADFMTRRR